MKYNKKHSAFSLIELSIVIIIIGIIIAGILQGNILLNKSSIKSARALTDSSPVASIDGLTLWLDTISQKSFPEFSSIDDGDAVGQWNEINPTTTRLAQATQTDGTKKPLYVTGALGRLPALEFDGTNDFMTMSSVFFPTGKPYITNSFSIFVVAQANSTHELDPESSTSALGTGNQEYVLYPEWGMVYDAALSGAAGMGISFGTNGISFYEHTNGYMPPLMAYAGPVQGPTVILSEYNNKSPSLYINGELMHTGITSPKIPFLFRTIGGGAWGYFTGFIGEIIVFDRVLKSSERDDVNNYLKQKWGIY